MSSKKSTFDGFPSEAIKFLRGLQKNNNRAWFAKHRAEYDEFYTPVAKAFATELGAALKKISPSINYEPRIGGEELKLVARS